MNKQLRVNLHYAFLLSRILIAKIPRNKSPIGRSSCLEPPNTGKEFHSEAEKNIVVSPLGQVTVPKKLLHELIFEYSSVWERKTAVKCARSGRKYTFRQLRNLSETLAAGFQNKFKLSKGDVLAVIMRNCPEYPIIFLAISQSGTIMTTVNPQYTQFEMQTQLAAARPKMIITDTEVYEKCRGVAEELKMSLPIVVVRSKKEDPVPQGAIDLFELFNDKNSGTLTPVGVETEDTLVIPFSSGTSGVPKGVLLSHRNMVSNLIQLTHPETTIMFTPSLFHQTSILGILPMSHIFGLVVMTFFTLKEGGLLVTLPSFEPREFVATMYRNKIAVIYAVPPLISFLANPAVKGRYLKKAQFIVNGAARYSIKDAEKIMEKAENLKIVQGYGMTESSPVLTHTYSKRMQKLNSIGVPITGTKLKIVSLETGQALPEKKEGELYALGPQVMKGYLDKPEETKKVLINGWLRTGDMAYYDEDGDFFIVDRVKELIKVSGFQVAPAELEETLKIHPKVKDVVVVGVPHEKHGEVPKAFVIPVKKDDLTVEEVHKFMSEKLSVHKQLKGGVEFMEDFPRGHTGKVLREVLKKKG